MRFYLGWPADLISAISAAQSSCCLRQLRAGLQWPDLFCSDWQYPVPATPPLRETTHWEILLTGPLAGRDWEIVTTIKTFQSGGGEGGGREIIFMR